MSALCPFACRTPPAACRVLLLLAGGGLLGGGLAGGRLLGGGLLGRRLLGGGLLRRGLLGRRGGGLGGGLLGGGLLRRRRLRGTRGLLGGGLLRRRGRLLGRARGLLRGARGLLGGGLLARGLGDGGRRTGQAALGGLLDRDVVLRELLRAAHQVLEALTSTEAGYGGLLDPNPLARLRVAGVAGRTVDLLEGTEAGDRDPVTRDHCTDEGVQDRVDSVGGLLPAAQLVGNRFYELRLVHVFPFGDIARTNLFKLFRTLGRYIPQIKHETG
ncbi:hypothetical protein SAM23877_5308 [Streptomyces ambofaciens ATCC 23877]|uniref:Uncharacterized protein n=1 Tax=Streptomyces ambofaciens (strain ATCC 23877 / 3486 / DSM 40053 / JCM 4204 / NBRC 12836 / NRRL B-2516) TaxID=278992 RepID=A0A0K2AZG0_STRA7|nr:hypothetical protein SAM23877_5308 [Streptomyces ambofaciens ATCC 23877]